MGRTEHTCSFANEHPNRCRWQQGVVFGRSAKRLGSERKERWFKTEEKQKEWDTLEKNRQELWAKDNAIRDEIDKNNIQNVREDENVWVVKFDDGSFLDISKRKQKMQMKQKH